MATIKVYLPVNSLQIYIEEIGGEPIPYTANHLRIYPSYRNNSISIVDELKEGENIYPIFNGLFTDITDEAGISLGATLKDVVDKLSLIIG